MTTTTITTPRCDWYREGYPHPGCAEFGEPDRFNCDANAEHEITFMETWNPEPPHEPFVVHHFVCDDHLDDELHELATDSGAVDIVSVPLDHLVEVVA